MVGYVASEPLIGQIATHLQQNYEHLVPKSHSEMLTRNLLHVSNTYDARQSRNEQNGQNLILFQKE